MQHFIEIEANNYKSKEALSKGYLFIGAEFIKSTK